MEANNDGSNKKPACDNCKDRKTKCDRRSPCSSCIAAALDCRISRRVPERRQRVLISARYDEAMENVNRSLQEVSEGLQKLLRNSEQTKGFPNSSPALFTANYVSNASGPSEGYRGDSSFKAHVQRVTEALRDATANVDSSLTDQSFATAMTATQLIKEVADSEETTSSEENVNSPSFKVQYPELEGRPLPPLEPVLKLLRLIHTEKQRFFIDTPVIDEAEFAELCQKVYFAINDYSLSTWTTVNTGLYYLFLGLEEHERSQVGITLADIQAYTRLLSVNIEAGIHSFRLCHEPSMEGCQALALLTAFCMKSGRSALAWSLIAAASRMCIDLGWHRLSKHPKGPELSKKRRIFWWVYVIDKGMAFTLGRTPSIHQYDVATERTSFPLDIPGPPGYLYGGFVEFAVIVGDMHIQLFSASAQRTSPQVRVENAKAFASRLFQVNNSLKQTLRDEPPADARFQDASVLFDIIMHCLVTIVYRIVPCGEPKPHPLQCHTGCIEAARQALSTIVQASQTLGQRNPLGWNMFLNLLFSLVPFTCFVVLAGNTIACLSPEDLALLSATVRAIEPMATSSPSGKKLFDVCRSFYQVASFSVTRQAAISAAPASAPVAVTQVFGNPPVGSFSEPLDSSAAPLYEHIMAPQDWDTVMGEFDLGIGAGAMASFVEPYIPFDGRVL